MPSDTLPPLPLSRTQALTSCAFELTGCLLENSDQAELSEFTVSWVLNEEDLAYALDSLGFVTSEEAATMAAEVRMMLRLVGLVLIDRAAFDLT